MPGLILAVVGALLYANSLSAPFTFDDEAAIVGNASIRQLATAVAPPDRGEPVAGRPIVNLSFALNYAVGGLDPRGYHAVNIALHIACALLLFALVRLTLSRATETRRHGDPSLLAFAAALLWVVHPLNSETVTYVSQRTESLMALFYLLTLYAGARGWLVAAVAACAAGMACKETMATAPIVVLLYDRTFLFGSFGEAWRARWRFYLALAATWGLLLALIWSGPRWESAGFSTGISPWSYLLNQAVMLVEYLRRVVWPRSLVLDYGEPLPYMLGDVLPQALLVVALLAATVWALVRRPAIGFVLACFFIILAPTSSVIPIATEVGAERRMYLPLAALVTLAVLAARSLPKTWVAAGALLLAIPLGAATVDRNAEYRDGLTLWQSSLDRWPTARAHRNVATELKRAGRAPEAIAHLREAIKGHPEGRYALGYELYEQRRYREAAQELRQFIREYPHDASLVTAHLMTADALRAENEFAASVEHYEAVLAARPADVAMWVGLGFALASSRQMPRAEAALTRAVTLAPRDSVARMTLGLVVAAQPGRLDEAARHLRAAVEIDPANAEAREHLAKIEALSR